MDFAEIERRLLGGAFLFDDPAAYAAGVADALCAVRRALERERHGGRMMDAFNATDPREPALAVAWTRPARPIGRAGGTTRPRSGAI